MCMCVRASLLFWISEFGLIIEKFIFLSFSFVFFKLCVLFGH